VTATRRSTRPSPRPKPREVDPEFTRLVDDWLSDNPTPAETVEELEEDIAVPRQADAPSRLSIGLVGVLAFIFVFGALFGLAAFHSVLVQNQLRLDRLSRDVEREQARYDELRIEAGNAAAPYRIIAQATARGMLPATSKEKLQAVLPEQGKLSAPANHPFGNVSNFVPPVVSAPPPQTTAPSSTAPSTTAPTTATPTTASAPPVSTAPTAKAGT
jgi:hypothetical protein